MNKKEEAALKKAAKAAEKLEAEKKRTQQMKEIEHGYTNCVFICGVDEAGRGPFAGPVAAGAVILDLKNEEKEILYINDSKKLSEKKRELLYTEILSKAVAVGIGIAGARVIDKINILNATYLAMQRAIANLRNTADIVNEWLLRKNETNTTAEAVEMPAVRPGSTADIPGTLHDNDFLQNSPSRICDNVVLQAGKACAHVQDALQAGKACADGKAALQAGKACADGNDALLEDKTLAYDKDIHELVKMFLRCEFYGKMPPQPLVIPDMILADAVTIPDITIPQKAIIKGDAKSISIAAASIVAKVTRDHIMYEYDMQHPEYGFCSHKGYGTAAHIAAIKKYGMLDIHRRSFIHL